MENPVTNQKTGQTPEAIESTPGREVLKVAEMKIAMVVYTDADNQTPRTRLIAIMPGTGTVYFLDDKIVGKQTQSWFAQQVISKLRTKE